MTKKRKKSYRPRPFCVNGIGVLMRHAAMQNALEEDQVLDLALSYRIAFEQMLTGQASEENWGTVVCSLNIALMLAEKGIGANYIDSVNKALEGAFRARIRAEKTGKWGFDGSAIQDIKYVLALHDEQIKIAKRADIVGALYEIKRRINSGDVFCKG